MRSQRKMKISIIGIGRVGGALAIALAKNGFEIENLVTRKKEDAEKIAESIKSKVLTEFSQISSDIVFITTQDFEIEKVAENLAINLQNKPIVFHTSGALSSNVLQDLRTIGCKNWFNSSVGFD